MGRKPPLTADNTTRPRFLAGRAQLLAGIGPADRYSAISITIRTAMPPKMHCACAPRSMPRIPGVELPREAQFAKVMTPSFDANGKTINIVEISLRAVSWPVKGPEQQYTMDDILTLPALPTIKEDVNYTFNCIVRIVEGA